jgi:hypothetical protein
LGLINGRLQLPVDNGFRFLVLQSVHRSSQNTSHPWQASNIAKSHRDFLVIDTQWTILVFSPPRELVAKRLDAQGIVGAYGFGWRRGYRFDGVATRVAIVEVLEGDGWGNPFFVQRIQHMDGG